MILASARTQVADYASTVIYVYTLLIVLFIVIQLLFAVGLRPPYSRTVNAVLAFLRDICEPFLRIFRRLIPSFGGLDFSPMLAIFALAIFNRIQWSHGCAPAWSCSAYCSPIRPASARWSTRSSRAKNGVSCPASTS